MTMARTYYVCLEGVMEAQGEAWVEVEYIMDADGNIDNDAMIAKAKELAMKDVAEDRIEWDHDGVGGVIITDVEED